ncbi:MAG: hypothetical protein QOI01_5253, partial [Mycobacterium sp.]|nr:hypothetical protein [Mycobacterium sp.]
MLLKLAFTFVSSGPDALGSQEVRNFNPLTNLV